ncbi:MAG: class I SAM-dependent methyltransferase [Methanomassiliicoccales archaeon]|nr:MAG: class I SAM-dependent methyltransferase [Methanomassiliicoccales archaeon]
MLVKPTCKNRKKEVNQHYQRQWESYTIKDVKKRVENLRCILDPIISRILVKPGARILDIGSGPGIIPIRMIQDFNKDSGFMIYDIDISREALQLGNKVIQSMDFGDSIHLVEGDVEFLPFQRECFDAVVSNATMNLLPDKKKGFSEIARVTKVGGSIVIADCIAREDKRCKGDIYADDGLWSACVSGAPTKAEFIELSKGAKFAILETKDMTKEVSYLVNNELWDWPEFIENDLDYFIFSMKKQ